MAERASQTYEFGSFKLRMDDGVLLKNNQVVSLTPKAIQILILLVRQHGRLIEKDEILREVWVNTFVDESSVIRNISVLRKILREDDADKPYIETFHRRGYRFVAPIREETVRQTISVREIAVLPFTLLNSKPETEHLGLGLADTLTTHLSNFEQIIVRPTTAVLKYAETNDPLRAGRELRVEAVLSGSLQFVGEYLRVNLQLISVETSRSIWGAYFDNKMTDLLGIQDSISEQVVKIILPQLTQSEKKSIAAPQTVNSEAYQLYLRGRYHWNKRTPDNLKKAIFYLQQAIEQDERYALAYAALADCFILATGYDVAADFTLEHRRQKFEMARQMAKKALEIDETLGEAVASLAHVHFACDWDFEEAENLYRLAIALKPHHSTARLWYSSFLNAFGRYDESLRELRKALSLDVLSPMINRNLGAALSFAGKFDEAAAQYETTLEIEPTYVPAMYALGLLHSWAGRHAEALELFERAALIAPDNQLVQSGFGEIYAAAGEREKALQILEKLKAGQFSSRLSWLNCFAVIHNYLGETDAAFACMERAFNERDTGVLLLNAYPELRNQHDDPRFISLLRRIGLRK